MDLIRISMRQVNDSLTLIEKMDLRLTLLFVLEIIMVDSYVSY